MANIQPTSAHDSDYALVLSCVTHARYYELQSDVILRIWRDARTVKTLLRCIFGLFHYLPVCRSIYVSPLACLWSFPAYSPSDWNTLRSWCCNQCSEQKLPSNRTPHHVLASANGGASRNFSLIYPHTADAFRTTSIPSSLTYTVTKTLHMAVFPQLFRGTQSCERFFVNLSGCHLWGLGAGARPYEFLYFAAYCGVLFQFS